MAEQVKQSSFHFTYRLVMGYGVTAETLTVSSDGSATLTEGATTYTATIPPQEARRIDELFPRDFKPRKPIVPDSPVMRFLLSTDTKQWDIRLPHDPDEMERIKPFMDAVTTIINRLNKSPSP